MNLFHICLAFATLAGFATAGVKSRVLILSGANNHDWKTTTPAIRKALEDTGRFEVAVEENVMAMKPEAFAPYAVVLGNFNTESGGARGFAIFLGHDTVTMKNTAWKTLLQRGTEWAATGKVTIPPAGDWPSTKADAERMTR